MYKSSQLASSNKCL